MRLNVYENLAERPSQSEAKKTSKLIGIRMSSKVTVRTLLCFALHTNDTVGSAARPTTRGGVEYQASAVVSTASLWPVVCGEREHLSSWLIAVFDPCGVSLGL